VTDVAVVAFAQSPMVRRAGQLNDVELVMPVVSKVLGDCGLTISDIGFTCSGSTDYLAGAPFSFVGALDAVGAWPPIEESHVEMDGAFALFEAWVRLQEGDIDAALVYAFGKSSAGPLRELLALQLDPYVLGPLWPDSISLAALQARACLDAGRFTESDMAAIASRSRRDAMANPDAHLAFDQGVDELMEAPYLVEPLRRHDCPPITDGAAAVVLATGELARRIAARPAWIRGIDHRIETHQLGSRDLTVSTSTKLAAEHAGVADGPVDVAELHAPFTHQELVLSDALGLDVDVRINPSGGALAANPMMVAGLARIGEASRRIWAQEAARVVAHATSGPCLQQNLVCVLEGE